MEDPFGNNTKNVCDAINPAAELLAQQRNELADLGKDTFNGNKNDGKIDPSQAYASIAAADKGVGKIRIETEKVRVWREGHDKLLAEKDLGSKRMQKKWMYQARKELKEWDEKRKKQLEKIRTSNRAAEERFIKEQNNLIEGSDWDRVSNLCDFNPTASKRHKDVSRMRSSLLHLKKDPRPISTPGGH